MRSRSEREIVLDILTRIRREQTYSHVAIREALDAAEESSMTTQQRAFIKRLTEGVIERRSELDEVIGRHTRKGTRIKPVIRDILRMGVYQILYMDAVPDSAACDEAVKLTKEQGKSSLSGFVNAVLRTVTRENKKESLSGEALSMPAWITQPT